MNHRTLNTRAPCAPAELHEAYLQALGEKVRAARARRGMTRKILARESDVSERYLAQLESGRGNISIGLLKQISDALGLDIRDLLPAGRERSPELSRLIEFLDRLPVHDLEEAAALLTERFRKRNGRHGRIALIGLRGAGKTTLGRTVAARLGLPFIDLASEIEKDAGMSLNEIFSLSGQSGYRRWEKRSLERVVGEHPRAIIATGGGLVSEAATFELLLNNCYTIWLKASPEEHMERVITQGDMRPMAGNREAMEDLRAILASRKPLYSEADATLDTSGKTSGQAAAELERLIREQRLPRQAAS